MTVSYRNKLSNYMSDADGKYSPIGSIVTSLVDVNSGTGGQSPEYSYPGYLYCDGRTLNIREYPQLYAAVRNTYGGDTQVTKTQSSNAGGIRRSYWINNKMFLNLYYDSGVNSSVKMPYPYGTSFRMTSLGSFPSTVFTINTFYILIAPTENVSAFIPYDGTVFAYEVQFPSGVDPALLNQPGSTLDFTQTGITHPTILFTKQFSIRDYPFNIGTFKLPDYRDRIIVGYGSVDGLGSPTVENALVNSVGQKGGKWFISKTSLLDGGVFFSVGSVKTRGYSSITSDITSFLSGNVQYTFGPLDDYIFSRPVEHFHYILSSEPDESFLVEFSGVPADQYAVAYSKTRANIIPFEPANTGGIPFGHSHGLSGFTLNDPKLATIGNTSSIGQSDGNGNYRVTSSPAIPVASITYDSVNNVCIVTTSSNHGFSANNFVTVSGALQSEYNGTFRVLSSGLLTQSFRFTPTTTPLVSPASGTITVRLASGTFNEQLVTPNPIAYTIDSATRIGGKQQNFDIPGTGVVFSTRNLSSVGTFTTTIVPPSTGEVRRIEINLIGPGGGGASSNTDGGTGGFAFATFNIDGTEYTIYAYGGGGGKSGNSGGAPGGGATYLIPVALLNLGNTVIEYAGSNGLPGQAGGGPGTSTSETIGGGLAGVAGTGGSGRSSSFTTTVNSPPQTFTASGSWTVPTPPTGTTSTTITVKACGGGGGNGNPNANSGCEGSVAIGGNGNGGALVTAILTQIPSSLSFTIGRAGQQGFNNRDGFINGTGYESGPSSGGIGASNGGGGGTGAWGNGATGGGGGGSTGVFFDGNAMIGAAGGGGGGGSGGGFNGGGTTDGCYAGGNAGQAATNLTSMTSAMDFNQGGTGTIGGCTAGGGGGGGAGCGPTFISNGGIAGQAGVGHNGNGGGTGGDRGNSAYRSDYCDASWSPDGRNGGGGGLDGYVEITVSRNILNYGAVGGAGGQGGSLNFTIKGKNIVVTAGLQSPGGGGGDGATSGNNGFVEVRYVGLQGGGSQQGDPTVPFARFYECNSSGVPGGGPRDDQAWKSSTFNDMIPLNPGLGSTATNKFSMISGAGAPTYGGFATQYLPFTGGPGDREYIFGPLDLSLVNRIRFTVIKGTNFNGGALPEEDLILYWKNVGSSTANLLNTIISSTDGSGSWQEKNINLESGSSARRPNVELIIKQTRVQNQDDNNIVTEDNYGISMITFFYDTRTELVFTPGNGSTLGGITSVTRNISALISGIVTSDGTFEMSSSTPISTTALVVPENDIPLITRYHRVKYLIKAI